MLLLRLQSDRQGSTGWARETAARQQHLLRINGPSKASALYPYHRGLLLCTSNHSAYCSQWCSLETIIHSFPAIPAQHGVVSGCPLRSWSSSPADYQFYVLGLRASVQCMDWERKHLPRSVYFHGWTGQDF